MKKIIVLSGSARKKGNTMKSVEAIQKKFEPSDQFEWEHIYLYDYNIKGCIGCKACIIKDGNACPFKDDVLGIMEKLKSADGIIFASPVYSRAVTGQLKNFIDRTNYALHRPSLIGIPSISVSTTDIGMAKKVANYLTVIASSMGTRNEGVLAVRMGSLNNNPKYRKKVERDIDKIGEKFRVSVLEGKKQNPTFEQLLRFNFWRTRAVISREKYPNDYNYWNENGWADSEYYYDAKIKFVHSMVIKLLIRKLEGKIREGVLY